MIISGVVFLSSAILRGQALVLKYSHGPQKQENLRFNGRPLG